MIPSRLSRGIDESHTTVGAKGEARFRFPYRVRQNVMSCACYELRDVPGHHDELEPRYRRCASGCCHSCLRRTPRSLWYLN